MVLKLEYDSFVHRLNPATVAVLALALMVPAAGAQVNGAQAKGVPASVTSTGFGGSTGPRGTPASVTSTGFGTQSHRAPATPPSVPSQSFVRRSPGFTSHPQPSHHPRHDHDGLHHPQAGGVYAVPYYYPYADSGGYDVSEQPAEDDATADEYQGGPTIFDRRGPGAGPVQDSADEAQSAPVVKEARETEDESVNNQPDTLLIFKDGHQLEVSNYAIVGSTLFDLSGGQRHKIPLSELNLTATMKENDDRGVDFQLPAGFRAD
jgi:hypothetical protein